MPPKAPKAKPKPVPRRGATAGPSNTDATSAQSSVAASPTPVATGSPAATTEPTIPRAPVVMPPKGRLDSLASPSARGGPLLGPTGSKFKFKPKVVQRKSKEERESLEAKFPEPPTAESSRGGSSRGRARGGRGGRSRGGRGGRFSAPVSASGPFGLGSVVPGHREKILTEQRGTSSRRAAKYGSNVKKDPTGDSVQPDYSSSEDSDDERVDIELIARLARLSEDEIDADIDSCLWGVGAPVRVPRDEHIERQTTVNTDSSTKSKAELKAIKEQEMPFETEIKVKPESEDDDTVRPPSSPANPRRKVKVSDSPEAKRKREPSSSPLRRRRTSSSFGKKPLISTIEEREELERLEHDRKLSLAELGGSISGLTLRTDKVNDADGDVLMLSSAGAAVKEPNNAEIENKAFIFQFPPLLPHLVDSASQTQPRPADAEGAHVVRPVADFEPGSFAARKQAATNRAILNARLSQLTANPPAGIVGKLRVHKSGRITMRWGTTEGEDGEGVIEMEVNRGASCDFLQELVVLKEESPYGENDVDENKNRCGIAYSLGAVRGKYIVSPDFEKLVKARPRKLQATREEKDQPASPVKQKKDPPASPVKQQKRPSGPTAKRRKGKEVEKRAEIV